jgi:hypothetical protein
MHCRRLGMLGGGAARQAPNDSDIFDIPKDPQDVGAVH